MNKSDHKIVTRTNLESLLKVLEARFMKNMNRHEGIKWQNIQNRLLSKTESVWFLNEMERTGGEPDVVGYDASTDEYIFFDCSTESPIGRRNVCYDQEALESRKENKPKDSAVGMANAMGIEILTEEDYRDLQSFGDFDTKTSSWLRTPQNIRDLGGAIFGDHRYGRTFVYHNSAGSYYSARGFRGRLRI